METQEKITLFAIVMFIVLLISTIAISIFGLHYQTSKGSHKGIITAVQKEGLFIKTNAVYFKTGASSSQEDGYCATDEVYADLEKALENGAEITINYIGYMANGIFLCSDNSQVITKVNF